jgi:hypothetical protein
MDTTLKCLVAMSTCALLAASAWAENANDMRGSHAVAAESEASPIYGVKIPAGYRKWELVAVSYETSLDEFRGILGNATAIKAYKDGMLHFPDGTILTKLAWKRVPLPEATGAFVTGSATTVQIMVKDSKKYASTGGWGFGRFVNGKPVDEAQHRTCFACHQAHVQNHDLVFTRFEP